MNFNNFRKSLPILISIGLLFIILFNFISTSAILEQDPTLDTTDPTLSLMKELTVLKIGNSRSEALEVTIQTMEFLVGESLMVWEIHNTEFFSQVLSRIMTPNVVVIGHGTINGLSFSDKVEVSWKQIGEIVTTNDENIQKLHVLACFSSEIRKYSSSPKLGITFEALVGVEIAAFSAARSIITNHILRQNDFSKSPTITRERYDPYIRKLENLARTLTENPFPSGLFLSYPSGTYVYFVHGYHGSNDEYTDMINYLTTAGLFDRYDNLDDQPLFFDYFQRYDAQTEKEKKRVHKIKGGISTYAEDFFAQLVNDHTGPTQIDIVAHSLGGIITREMLRNHYYSLNASGIKIGRIITLGTPHRGTELASNPNLDLVIWLLTMFGANWDTPVFRSLSPFSSFISTLNYEPWTYSTGIEWYTIAAHDNDLWAVLAAAILYGGAANDVLVPSYSANGLDTELGDYVGVTEKYFIVGHGQLINDPEQNTYPDVNQWLAGEIDTDGDGLSDVEEDFLYNTDPESSDTDEDGMLDGWEVTYSLDPTSNSDANLDYDNDNLTNYQEYNYSTDPRDSDSDDDGVPDGWEVDYIPDLDPNVADATEDPDNDYYLNLEEYQLSTDPTVPNDGDGTVDVDSSITFVQSVPYDEIKSTMDFDITKKGVVNILIWYRTKSYGSSSYGGWTLLRDTTAPYSVGTGYTYTDSLGNQYSGTWTYADTIDFKWEIWDADGSSLLDTRTETLVLPAPSATIDTVNTIAYLSSGTTPRSDIDFDIAETGIYTSSCYYRVKPWGGSYGSWIEHYTDTGYYYIGNDYSLTTSPLEGYTYTYFDDFQVNWTFKDQNGVVLDTYICIYDGPAPGATIDQINTIAYVQGSSGLSDIDFDIANTGTYTLSCYYRIKPWGGSYGSWIEHYTDTDTYFQGNDYSLTSTLYTYTYFDDFQVEWTFKDSAGNTLSTYICTYDGPAPGATIDETNTIAYVQSGGGCSTIDFDIAQTGTYTFVENWRRRPYGGSWTAWQHYYTYTGTFFQGNDQSMGSTLYTYVAYDDFEVEWIIKDGNGVVLDSYICSYDGGNPPTTQVYSSSNIYSQTLYYVMNFAIGSAGTYYIKIQYRYDTGSWQTHYWGSSYYSVGTSHQKTGSIPPPSYDATVWISWSIYASDGSTLIDSRTDTAFYDHGGGPN